MTASGFEQHSAQSPCPQAESDRQADTPTDMHAVITADFEALIRHRGYSRPTITLHARLADAFCRAMRVEGLTFGALDEASVTRLTADICRSLRPTVRRYAPHVLERFRDHLIEHAGAPPRALPAPDTSPRACLRRAYRCYLVEQRGLAPGTVDHCLRFHDRFLDHRFGAQGPDRMADLDGIHPGDITGFMLAIRRPDAARRDKTVPSYLRTFFRFLFWSGHTKRDLADAVPKARNRHSGAVPRYLPPEDIERLLAAARAHETAGRRNHAMLLLMARLGLRPPELVAIELDDIDWRAGEILIRGKGGLHDRMPLPAEVGEAVVDYIRHERRGAERALFVAMRPPFRRFRDAQVLRSVLTAACEAADIVLPQSRVGSRILRHSLATDMLRRGASLQEIGDVLRHRAPMTTTIYARHDAETLRGLARPWPLDPPAGTGNACATGTTTAAQGDMVS